MKSSTISSWEVERGETGMISEFCCCSLGPGGTAEEAEEAREVEAVGLKGNKIKGDAGCEVDGLTGSRVDIDGWLGGAGDKGEKDMF